MTSAYITWTLGGITLAAASLASGYALQRNLVKTVVLLSTPDPKRECVDAWARDLGGMTTLEYGNAIFLSAIVVPFFGGIASMACFANATKS